jgi:hypothetical protein
MKFQDALSQLAWQDFEVLVANYYRDQGFDVMHCGNGTMGVRGSGGVDLRLRKDGRLVLVQCRHESIHPVDPPAIQRLLAVRDEDDAAEAIVVTSGEFSAEARRAAAEGAVTLVDGVELRELLGGDRLEKLPPPRMTHGLDPQHGESRIVVKDLTPPSRGRRRGWWRLPRRSRGRRKRGPMLLKLLLAVALVGLLAYYAPELKRLAGRPEPSAPAATTPVAEPDDGSVSVEVPLPTDPPPPPADN